MSDLLKSLNEGLDGCLYCSKAPVSAETVLEAVDHIESLERERNDLADRLALVLRNVEAIFGTIPVRHRSNVLIDEKPALLQSLGVTVAHLVGQVDRKEIAKVFVDFAPK